MSARITPADVDRVAALARIDVPAAEREPLAAELASILEYAAQVLEVDTAGVPPMSHVADDDRARPMRADEQRPSLPRDEAVRAAPDRDPATGLFKVPRVLGT
jgi:aspartyl-tRNA(Asn)/glutamyl-tRNA(Gln) amidotransferase subunit C